MVLFDPPFLFCFWFDVDLCGNWDSNRCSVPQVLEQISGCVQAMITVCCLVTLFYMRESSADGMERGWFLMVHVTDVLHVVKIVIY